MTMFVALLTVLVGYFIYVDAKRRGRETAIALLWAVASVMLPIAGIPLYFLFGRKQAIPTKDHEDGIIDIEAAVLEETITCSNCGKEMDKELLACPHCNQHTTHG